MADEEKNGIRDGGRKGSDPVAAPAPVPDTNLEAERLRRQRMRSLAIALALALMVGLFYMATIVRMGGNVLKRTM